MDDKITFSFGENWRSFVDSVSEGAIESARRNIEEWLGVDGVKGKTVLDIGCGSGIHSFCFMTMGARRVVSFDFDPKSVDATNLFKRRLGDPSNWEVTQGSVLDKAFLDNVGQFDVVYAWGVLHHTGAMWEAVENTCRLVTPGGLCWIALYMKGPKYEKTLAMKKAFNSGFRLRKWLMIQWHIALIIHERLLKVGRKTWLKQILRGELKQAMRPFRWNKQRDRGMNEYHDLIDWLGGLPYEVASTEEVVQHCRACSLLPVRIAESEDGGVSNFLFVQAEGG